MRILPQNLFRCFPVVLLAFALLPSTALAGAMEGTVSATSGAGGKAESATFTYWNGKETVEVKVYLDKMGQKFAQEANGRDVQVSGSFFTKKKERWFKVKSYFLVYTGILSVTRDDKKKITAVKFQSDDKSLDLPMVLDGAVRKLAEKDNGQKYRVIGTLVTARDKTQSLKAKSIFEIVTLKGDLKSVVDKKGNVRSARFTVTDGKKKSVYGIHLDGKGREVAQNYPKESVEITGILMGKVIRVLAFQKA